MAITSIMRLGDESRRRNFLTSYAPKLHTIYILKITALSQDTTILCQIVVLYPIHLTAQIPLIAIIIHRLPFCAPYTAGFLVEMTHKPSSQ